MRWQIVWLTPFSGSTLPLTSESVRVHQGVPTTVRVHQGVPTTVRVHQGVPTTVRVHQGVPTVNGLVPCDRS